MKNYILIIFALLFNGAAPAQKPSVGDVIKAGMKQGAKQNKNLFVVFTASWCGPCHGFKKKITDTAQNKLGELFDKNYVVLFLNVLESDNNKHLEYTGATELFNKYVQKDPSIPFYIILDKKGNLLGDAYFRPGNNPDEPKVIIGTPYTEPEMLAFIRLLKKTSKLNDTECKQIAAEFNPQLNWETLQAKLQQKN